MYLRIGLSDGWAKDGGRDYPYLDCMTGLTVIASEIHYNSNQYSHPNLLQWVDKQTKAVPVQAIIDQALKPVSVPK